MRVLRNGSDQLRAQQLKYGLQLPFGQDEGYPRPNTIVDYRTGGTPWFIVINRQRVVVYNDYRLSLADGISVIDSALADDPAPTPVTANVCPQPEQSNYVVEFPNGAQGRTDYQRDGNVLNITHTEVSGNARGRGLGGWMMELVLEQIENEGLQVSPHCGFARHYLNQYQRWSAISVEPHTVCTHLREVATHGGVTRLKPQSPLAKYVKGGRPDRGLTQTLC